MKCRIKGVFIRYFLRYIGDIELEGHVVNHHLNAWTQIWPREAAKTALAMMHVACRGRFGLPKEIASQIGMHIFAGRDVDRKSVV
jgi:hypothetical protein